MKLFQPHEHLTAKPKLKFAHLAIFGGVFAAAGVAVVLSIAAAGTPNAFEPETGTLAAGATTTTVSGQSGTGAVKFAAAATPTPTPSPSACQGAANTPGGADPWGGCWPGAYNTGYPHGLPGDTRTPVTLTNYTGDCTIRTDNVVIDSKNITCPDSSVVVYAKNLTIKNSKVNGIVYLNSGTASATVMDSEVNGGNQTTYPTLGGAQNITVIRVNAYGGQHTVMCYGNCRVEDSWLHDQFEAGSGPHQNAFLSNDGSDYTIRHNVAHCTTTGCTGDISFTDDGVTSNALIDKNLFMPTPGSYCIYPGTGPKNNPMYQFTVTNNVFKRGANNKCATYGPVYAWDTPNNNPGTSGYLNEWSNNKWEDGTVLNP